MQIALKQKGKIFKGKIIQAGQNIKFCVTVNNLKSAA